MDRTLGRTLDRDQYHFHPIQMLVEMILNHVIPYHVIELDSLLDFDYSSDLMDFVDDSSLGSAHVVVMDDSVCTFELDP